MTPPEPTCSGRFLIVSRSLARRFACADYNTRRQCAQTQQTAKVFKKRYDYKGGGEESEIVIGTIEWFSVYISEAGGVKSSRHGAWRTEIKKGRVASDLLGSWP